MRLLMTMLALLGTLAIQAQDKNPVFEKDGDLVKATYYHENGLVAQEGHYLNGELHGEWKMFDTKGNKLAIGQYSFGEKTGKWFFWDDNGLKEVDYLDNQVANVTQWNNGEAVVLNK